MYLFTIGDSAMYGLSTLKQCYKPADVLIVK